MPMPFTEWMDAMGLKPEEVADGVKERGEKLGLAPKISKALVYKYRERTRGISPTVCEILIAWSKEKGSKGRLTWESLHFPERYRKAS
jgi:hypothetical protein